MAHSNRSQYISVPHAADRFSTVILALFPSVTEAQRVVICEATGDLIEACAHAASTQAASAVLSVREELLARLDAQNGPRRGRGGRGRGRSGGG